MLPEATLDVPDFWGLAGEETGLRISGLEHEATRIWRPRLPTAILD